MTTERENRIDQHVGSRIRERRYAMGMTQMQLGESVGVKFQQIQKYENGMNRVSASRLLLIAEALDVPVAWFFEGLKTKAPERVEPTFDGRDIRLAVSINSLSSECRVALTNLVEALGKSPKA